MAKEKTKQAKRLLNPQEKPGPFHVAVNEAIISGFKEWRDSVPKACLKEIDNIQKKLHKECLEWQKKEPNELKDC